METIYSYVSNKIFYGWNELRPRCEPVYSKMSDILPNNY